MWSALSPMHPFAHALVHSLTSIHPFIHLPLHPFSHHLTGILYTHSISNWFLRLQPFIPSPFHPYYYPPVHPLTPRYLVDRETVVRPIVEIWLKDARKVVVHDYTEAVRKRFAEMKVITECGVV